MGHSVSTMTWGGQVVSICLRVLWLVLPVIAAAIVHMVVVRARWLEHWAVPLDGGRAWRGARVFGDNKTWRGVLVMVSVSAASAAAQGLLAGEWAERSGVAVVDYMAFAAVEQHAGLQRVLGYALLGALLGAGYVVGELPNSFAKRRCGILPGQQGRGKVARLLWAVSHVDSVAAGMALLCLVMSVPRVVLLAALLLLPAVHWLLGSILYWLGIKRAR
jgi:hypothetical protein